MVYNIVKLSQENHLYVYICPLFCASPLHTTQSRLCRSSHGTSLSSPRGAAAPHWLPLLHMAVWTS